MVSGINGNFGIARRVKALCIAGLLACALMVGAGASANVVSAAAPQTGAVSGGTATNGTYSDPTIGTVQKPKTNTNNGKKLTKTAQPVIICFHYTQAEWQDRTGEDPGPGGYTDCILLE